MRHSLSVLMQNAIILQYQLPHNASGVIIPRASISTRNDDCLKQLGTNQDIANLIYNGIVEYAYNDNEIDLAKLNELQIRALMSKLRYNPSASPQIQLSYGFQGEVLLHLILEYYYHAHKAIARGYMYSPLENSEIKGYDSYLMIEGDTSIDLYFGEAKFYLNGYRKSLESIFDSINVALSDDYLERNFIAFDNQYEHLYSDSKISSVIDAWRDNPTINLIQEIKKYSMRLVYPMLVIFDNKAKTYDELILKVITYINNNYTTIQSKLSIPYTLFFILLPVDDSRNIKNQVLTWIKQKQPLMP